MAARERSSDRWISITQSVLFGGLIIFFLVIEPEGLNRLWRNIRNYFRVWPFSY